MPGTQVQLKIVKVGQGDCILITAPSGALIMVDAGSLGGVSIAEGYTKDDVRRQLWGDAMRPPRDISVLVMTHHDRDHYNLLGEVLQGAPIHRTYYSGNLPSYSVLAFRRWYWGAGNAVPAVFLTEPQSISVNTATPGMRTIFEETTDNRQQFQLQVMAANYIPANSGWDLGTAGPIPINTRSIVLRGTLAGNSFLLTADATDLTEAFMIDQYDDELLAEVIKVAHHGSGGSSSQAFIDYVRARQVVVSCRPQGTRFKHPRADVLDRWSRSGALEGMQTPHTIAYWGGVGNLPPLAYYTLPNLTKAIWETGLNGTMTYVFGQDGSRTMVANDPGDGGDGDQDDDDYDPDEEEVDEPMDEGGH